MTSPKKTVLYYASGWKKRPIIKDKFICSQVFVKLTEAQDWIDGNSDSDVDYWRIQVI